MVAAAVVEIADPNRYVALAGWLVACDESATNANTRVARVQGRARVTIITDRGAGQVFAPTLPADGTLDHLTRARRHAFLARNTLGIRHGNADALDTRVRSRGTLAG